MQSATLVEFFYQKLVNRNYRCRSMLEEFEGKLNDSEHKSLTKILIEYETLLRVTDEMKDDVPWQAELF